MTQDTKKMLAEHVENVKEELDNKNVEDLDDYDSFLDPLDVEITCGLNGDVTGVTLTVTTGGPHIEVDLRRDRVVGYWGGEEVTREFYNPNLSGYLFDHYEELFGCVR